MSQKTKTIVITGASDGIGRAASRALKDLGHQMVIVGRNEQKTKAWAQELEVDYFTCDFAQLSLVSNLADKLLLAYPRIDVLANNAGGIMPSARQVTIDGNELTFQVNHLAPFLLTNLLIERLVGSKATVINTSSIAHSSLAQFNIEDLQNEVSYSPESAYGNAKLCNILHVRELNRRYGADGLNAVSYHPGIIRTNFAEGSGSIMKLIYRTPLKYLLESPKKGAETLVWLADKTPGKDFKAGKYYVRKKAKHTSLQAMDDYLAYELWIRSQALLEL
jgi:NAD(P)-dependent dehydrogenase (short-subunit alcohol dehydrogenase family)